MKITLFATVTGKLWGGESAQLQIERQLRRKVPIREELTQILRSCGDFDGGAKAFAEDSYISLTRLHPRKANVFIYTTRDLAEFPSLQGLMS